MKNPFGLIKKPDPEKEEQLKNEPLERKDWAAMLSAAFFTLFLPCLVILLIIGGGVYLLFSLF